MFVRIKKIKGRPYAYLVANEWTPWGSRQRVAQYLGKAHHLKRLAEGLVDLPTGFQQAVVEAVAQELQNHGFSKKGDELRKEDVVVNLQDKTIRSKTKKAVLAMNEGYLCDHTFKQLLSYEPEEKRDQTAKKLASTVLEAGLKLTDEQFVHLFEQIKGEE